AERYGRAIELATAAVPDHEDLQARLAALTRIGGGLDPGLLGTSAEDRAEQQSTYYFAERVQSTPSEQAAPGQSLPALERSAEHVLSTAPVPRTHPVEQGVEQGTTALQSRPTDKSPHALRSTLLTELSTLGTTAEQAASAEAEHLGSGDSAATVQATEAVKM